MRYIIGTNINVAKDVDDVQVIGGSDLSLTSADNGKTNIRNGALVISDTETVKSVPIKDNTGYETLNFTMVNNKDVYFVDTTAGNVNVQLDVISSKIRIIKTVAANSITFTSTGSSTINVTTLTALKSYVDIHYDVVNDTYWGLP